MFHEVDLEHRKAGVARENHLDALGAEEPLGRAGDVGGRLIGDVRHLDLEGVARHASPSVGFLDGPGDAANIFLAVRCGRAGQRRENADLDFVRRRGPDAQSQSAESQRKHSRPLHDRSPFGPYPVSRF